MELYMCWMDPPIKQHTQSHPCHSNAISQHHHTNARRNTRPPPHSAGVCVKHCRVSNSIKSGRTNGTTQWGVDHAKGGGGATMWPQMNGNIYIFSVGGWRRQIDRQMLRLLVEIPIKLEFVWCTTRLEFSSWKPNGHSAVNRKTRKRR